MTNTTTEWGEGVPGGENRVCIKNQLQAVDQVEKEKIRPSLKHMSRRRAGERGGWEKMQIA